MLRGSGFAEQVFDKQADTERAGERAQVLECGERELDGARRPHIVPLAEMDDEIAQRDVLGGFQRALDLIHGIDATRFFRVQHVYTGRAGAAHLAIGKKRCVHRERLKRIGAEPLCQLGDVLAAGVVEVLARGKDFDRLSAGAGGQLEQAGMQSMSQEQMS